MEQHTLDKLLYSFAEATKKIIFHIESGEVDKIDSLFDERQSLINQISEIEYDNKVFKAVAETLQVNELNDKLINTMNCKKREILLDLEKLKDGKNANETYLSNIFNKVSFLDKII